MKYNDIITQYENIEEILALFEEEYSQMSLESLAIILRILDCTDNKNTEEPDFLLNKKRIQKLIVFYFYLILIRL